MGRAPSLIVLLLVLVLVLVLVLLPPPPLKRRVAPLSKPAVSLLRD
jgi:hypothetical protein